MNKYTGRHAINLLESWLERMRKIAVLHFELDHPVHTSDNEMLESMAYGRGESNGHVDGHISDKTFYIALNYQRRAEKVNADLKAEIVEQLVELEHDQERLDYYLSLLEEREAEVLRLTYLKKQPQEAIARKMGLSVRTVQAMKSKAMTALSEMYEFAEKLR